MNSKKILILLITTSAIFLTAGSYFHNRSILVGSFLSNKSEHTTGALTKDAVARALKASTLFYRFPAEMELTVDSKKKLKAVFQYTFEPKLQKEMESLFRQYRPDYGAFVAIDASTGRIMSMVSFSDKPTVLENLALKATFPSASVFKVVTAAAAIEQHQYSPETVIPFNGSNHTLYRGNILSRKFTRWTRYMSLKDAFAKSVNTVFGRIGAYAVGPVELATYANRFGFNRLILSDLPIEEGHADIPKDPADAWGLAESASGFTPDNTMSPLQGALIASAVINQGVMMVPYVVQSVRDGGTGSVIYTAQPQISSFTIDRRTSEDIQSLMRETILRGTSRKPFRGFFRGELADLNVGGKTGSLTGKQPPGKYDWFVGFADDGTTKIAYAALTIHEKYWKVKSSYLARKAMENCFKGKLRGNSVASTEVLDANALANIAKIAVRSHQ